MKKKVVIVLMLVFLLCGCGKKGHLHEYDDFIKYVDNLGSEFNDKFYSYNLKGKYDVVYDEYGIDKNGDKTRTISFKLKDSNFVFDVVSAYKCTSYFDACCAEYTYTLTDHFSLEAFEYFFSEYSKLVNYDDKYCHLISDKCYAGLFQVSTKEELDYVINYMNGFLNYINQLDFRFVSRYYSDFYIYFDKTNAYGSLYSLNIYLDIKDDKIVYHLDDDVNNLEEHVNKYLNENYIRLH